MDITIYDYANNATIVALPEGVDKLHVVINTGDEVITYTDPISKQKITVDSSDCRKKAYIDYDYEITDIKKWADEGKELAAKNTPQLSYSRAEIYGYDWSMFDVSTCFDALSDAFFGSLSSIFSVDDDDEDDDDYDDDDDD